MAGYLRDTRRLQRTELGLMDGRVGADAYNKELPRPQMDSGTQGVDLTQGTVAFRVEPGQIAYLGAYRYDGRTADRTEGDIELARARLAEYPDVTGDVDLVVLKETTYE